MQVVTALAFGKVQGVFFRANVKKIADAMGVSGSVQNLPDGSVKIEAQGPKELLKEFSVPGSLLNALYA